MRMYFVIISIACILFNCQVNVNAKAKLLMSEEEALAYIFPEADTIKEDTHRLTAEQKKRVEKKLGLKLNSDIDAEYRFYIGSAGSDIIGYACIDAEEGKYGPIHYIVGIAPDGTVLDLAILKFKEIKGKRIKKRKFLNQFIGSFFDKKFRTKKQFQGVTGATISAEAVVSGVKKSLLLYKEFYGKETEFKETK